MGSRSSVRALATSIATAGLTSAQVFDGQSLNQMAGLSNLGNTGRSLATGSVSSTTVAGIAGRAVVNAGVSTALQGTSFRQGLINGAVADASAIGANAIGSTWGGTGTDPNAVFQTVAHGALGCAEAGLTGGNCGAGAAGAAAESILGNLVTLPATAQGTVSRTDATVYATSAAILGAVAGQAAGGHALSGTNAAINSAMNNRLLHPDEQKTLAQLQQGQSPQEQYRLAAAACALTHCAAGVPANNPEKAALEALQAAGQHYPTEQALLTKNGLFGYTLQNEVSDWASRDQVGTRAIGAFQGVAGAAGAVTGGGIIAAGCETGAACVAGFILAATSADYFQAGYRQMVSGSYTPTLGQQVLTDLGLSPTTAAWTYAIMSLGAEVGAAASLGAGAGAGAEEGAAGSVVRWDPLTGPGPLGEKLANTFRSASYSELTTAETTSLYRVWGGSAKEIAPYWTKTLPTGPLQSMIDSALDPAWGNTAINITRIDVPAGVKIYEGIAAPQGGLVGGGNQVFVPKVDPAWIVK